MCEELRSRIKGSNYFAVYSAMLYEAPNWCKALQHKKYLEPMLKTQRRGLLRVINESPKVLAGLAGSSPIDLMAKGKSIASNSDKTTITAKEITILKQVAKTLG